MESNAGGELANLHGSPWPSHSFAVRFTPQPYHVAVSTIISLRGFETFVCAFYPHKASFSEIRHHDTQLEGQTLSKLTGNGGVRDSSQKTPAECKTLSANTSSDDAAKRWILHL
mmetsp:Transcript_61483/g.146656  ORF Transcript_61483/g.146656 Transcript_61483/m.146656 type:complete len:114 (-) Transcript_61483:1976-2317(-)